MSYYFSERPAWDVKGDITIVEGCIVYKLHESEQGMICLSTNHPNSDNVSLYTSIQDIEVLYNSLPSRVRLSGINGLSRHKRNLLIHFLISDKRFDCRIVRMKGYRYLVKKTHPLYRHCTRKCRKEVD